MLFFNRKEVYVGGLEGYTKCCDILATHNIKYDTSKVDSNSTRSLIPQSAVDGIRPTKNTSIHYVYVHKNEYENAKFLLRQ